MKHLKRFENMESRDSMCDYLSKKCGYDMTELAVLDTRKVQKELIHVQDVESLKSFYRNKAVQ